MLDRLLAELNAAGMSDAAIATACQSTQPTIHRIRTGKTVNPGFVLGERIKALHGERCPLEAGAREAA